MCLSLPVMAFSLLACGGGSSIEGVTVTCGTRVSITDATGAFTYVEGQDCLFSLGDIPLRETSGITEGTIIFENNVAVAQLLQSLDHDNNPSNGITILPEVVSILQKNNINAVPNNNAEVVHVVDTVQNESA